MFNHANNPFMQSIRYLGYFLMSSKSQSCSHFFKRVLEQIPRTTAQSHFYHLYPKPLRELCINKLWNFLANTAFYISFNQDFAKTTQIIFACFI